MKEITKYQRFCEWKSEIYSIYFLNHMHQVTQYTPSPEDQEVRSPYGKATLLITGISALIGGSLGSENSTHGIEVGIAL